MICAARGPKNLTRYVIMELWAIEYNFMLGLAPAITYPLNKWRRAGKSNKRKEEKTDTNIDKPIKRPVPRPKTGQFPKRRDNGQFLRQRGASRSTNGYQSTTLMATSATATTPAQKVGRRNQG